MVRGYYRALNERDYEGVAAAIARDCEFVSIASGARFTGPEAVLYGLREFAEAFPDWTVEVDNLLAVERTVLVEWRTTGTHDGVFRGADPTGIRFQRRGCAVAEVEGPKIIRYRDYYDRLTLLEQLGLAPVL